MKILGIIKTKLRYKLIFGFVLISLFVGVISYISLRTIFDIENDYTKIAAKSLPLTHHLAEMKFNCLRLISSASESAYLIVESKNSTKLSALTLENNQVQQSCKSCHDSFTQYLHLAQESFPEMKENTLQLRNNGKLLQKVTAEFMNIKKQGISGTRALEKKEDMEVGEAGFLKAVNNAIDRINRRLDKDKAQLAAAISLSIRNIIVFNGLTFLFSLIIGIIMSRHISKPIIKLTELTENIKLGNLNASIDIKSSDEIGVLGRSFNEMARQINRLTLKRQIIYEVVHGVTTTENLDDLLKLIKQSLGKVLYSDNCFVALYDQNSGLFNFPLFIDKFDTTPEPLAMLKSCTAYVFRTGKPLLLTQKLFDQLVDQNEVELIGSNSPSWVGIPLQTPSKIIGVLVLQNYEEENVYSEKDLEYLALIGSQIAVAIERKLAEEAIHKSNAQLLRLNSEKDKFFSIIAHDLKSPFHGLLGLTEIMAADIKVLSTADISEYSHSLHDLAQNLYSLLENLLEWAQMQKGETSFAPDELNFYDITLQNIELANQRAEQKGISLINEVAATEIIYSDEQMINAILRNLISNAVKFTRKNGKIIVKAKKIANEMVEVSISDTGIGISEVNIKKLFKIEEKVSSKGTEGELSTGLGLLLCKEFVEKHSGHIWVESIQNIGSTFYFTLPSTNVTQRHYLND